MKEILLDFIAVTMRERSPSISLNTGFRIPFKNSSKIKKEARPPHLQDDEFFDTLEPGEVSREMGLWEQTKAMIEANATSKVGTLKYTGI